MPIIKSAKKRVKIAEKRRIRNSKYRRRLHDVQKAFYALVKEGNVAEASKMLPDVYKTIDVCSKKNILPSKRADRLKSKAQRTLSSLAAA